MRLTSSEIREMLTAEGEAQQRLFAQAREARDKALGNQVLLRGVIEISNYCQKNCDYCAMRAVNQTLSRYRLLPDEIVAIAAEIKTQGIISTIFLQSGQDPQSDRLLEEVIPKLKKFNLDILLCLGEKPKEVYEKFADLGANSYILKFETSDEKLYQEIAHTPLSRRLQCIRQLQEIGYKLGTGNIIGLPNQTLDTLVEDILLAAKLKPNFVSSSPFIPNQQTPLEKLSNGNLNLTLNTLAIYRLLLPNSFIPTVSALEKIHPGGQLMGLNAGANIITINFTPNQFREKYVIYSKKRFVVSLEHAMDIITKAGLKILQPVNC